MSMPLVFIPGLNCTAELFSAQIASLSGNRTIAIANHRRHDSIRNIATPLLDELPPRFVLAGLSMGGYIAFEMMRRAPERIAGLILMDTSARPDTSDATERRLRQIEIAEHGRFSEIPSLQIAAQLPPERQSDEALTAIIRRMAEETGAEAFIRQQKAIMSRPDSRPDLPRIACPTLVIVGDKDAITPPEIAKEIADGIPNAHLAVMPACGHLASIERPAAVNHAINEFLERSAL